MRKRKEYYFQSKGVEETSLLRWFETVYSVITDNESVEVMVTHVAAQFYLGCCVKDDRLVGRSVCLLKRVGYRVTSIRENASWPQGQATELIQEAAFGASAIAADFAAFKNPLVVEPVEITSGLLRQLIVVRAKAYRALLAQADADPTSKGAGLMKYMAHTQDLEGARNTVMDHIEACIHLALACDDVRENCINATARFGNP
jgi:hypothetical protein